MKKEEKNNKIYDKANVYKLSKEERKEIEKDPLKDFDDDKKNYAKELYNRIINTPSMPYVLLINDSFGMGKTFFITRFSLYLWKDKDIDSIYISVKEQDYINEPLTVVLKGIYKFLEKGQFAISKRSLIDNILDKIKKINITTDIPFSFKGDKLFNLLFGKSALSLSCTIGDLLEKEKDIDDLKEKLCEYINDTKHKKLVLVIDDLDRCELEYVKKFLEVVKHIFDISGLYIILMGNKALLEKIEINENNANNANIKRENFITKYINKMISFVIPNYVKVIEEYCLEDKLNKMYENKYMNKRNSIGELKCEALYYFKEHGFTLRQVQQTLDELVINVKRIKDFEIDLPYLLYKIVVSITNKKDTYGRVFDKMYFDYPLAEERIKKQEKLLNFNIPNITCNGYVLNNYINYLKKDLIIPSSDNCEEKIQILNDILEKYSDEKESIFGEYYTRNLSYIADDFKRQLMDFYKMKRDEIKQFYEEWQIETEENELKELYDNMFL